METKNSIAFEIKTLSNLLKRKLFEFAPPPGDDEFTDMQGQIIDFLYANKDKKELFQKDLEEKFSIRRSTASRLLQGLERIGIVRREAVSYDARLKRLILTPKAITNHEKIREKIEEIEAIVSRELTDDEMEMFFIIAKKIKNNLI